jgi:nitroreductase
MTQELTVTQAAHQRRSTKSFKSDAIPEATLQAIINATLSAPSSWNFQPTRIVLIKDSAQKEALADVAWRQKQILEAPVTMIFLASVRGWEKTMDSIIQTAVDSGAWSASTADFIRANAPKFQDALGAKQREYALKDAMICATHAALAAEALGLGSCYMNGWDEAGVKKVIGAEGNEDIAVALVLPIGYPAVTPANPGRLPQAQTVFVDRLS